MKPQNTASRTACARGYTDCALGTTLFQTVSGASVLRVETRGWGHKGRLRPGIEAVFGARRADVGTTPCSLPNPEPVSPERGATLATVIIVLLGLPERTAVRLKSFEAITAALENAGVRYLVAGGLAVAAHGHLRFTKDLDLVVELVPENIVRAFAALGSLGYKPTVPITSTQFANAELRASWIRDKGMQVLQFWCDAHIETPIDVFVTEPFPFEGEYQNALIKPLHGTRPVRFVSLPTLIRMKESAGRPQDLDDIAALRAGSNDARG